MSETFEPDTGEMIVKRVSVPIGLEELMEGLAKEVLLKKPDDIYLFAAEYFSRLLLLRDKGAYKVKTQRNAQSVVKQTPKQPVEKLLVRGASKQLSRQLSIRGESPTKKVPTVKRPPKHITRDNKDTDRNKYIDKRKARRSEAVEPKITEPKPKQIIVTPRFTQDNREEKVNNLNKRDRSLSNSRRGRSLSRNAPATPHQKNTSTPRKSEKERETPSENEKHDKIGGSDDRRNNDNKKETPLVSQISSIEESQEFVKDGKLTVTSPKIVKRPQILDNQNMINSIVVPQVIGITSSFVDNADLNKGDLKGEETHVAESDKENERTTQEHKELDNKIEESIIKKKIKDKDGKEISDGSVTPNQNLVITESMGKQESHKKEQITEVNDIDTNKYNIDTNENSVDDKDKMGQKRTENNISTSNEDKNKSISSDTDNAESIKSDVEDAKPNEGNHKTGPLEMQETEKLESLKNNTVEKNENLSADNKETPLSVTQNDSANLKNINECTKNMVSVTSEDMNMEQKSENKILANTEHINIKNDTQIDPLKIGCNDDKPQNMEDYPKQQDSIFKRESGGKVTTDSSLGETQTMGPSMEKELNEGPINPAVSASIVTETAKHVKTNKTETKNDSSSEDVAEKVTSGENRITDEDEIKKIQLKESNEIKIEGEKDTVISTISLEQTENIKSPGPNITKIVDTVGTIKLSGTEDVKKVDDSNRSQLKEYSKQEHENNVKSESENNETTNNLNENKTMLSDKENNLARTKSAVSITQEFADHIKVEEENLELKDKSVEYKDNKKIIKGVTEEIDFTTSPDMKSSDLVNVKPIDTEGIFLGTNINDGNKLHSAISTNNSSLNEESSDLINKIPIDAQAPDKKIIEDSQIGSTASKINEDEVETLQKLDRTKVDDKNEDHNIETLKLISNSPKELEVLHPLEGIQLNNAPEDLKTETEKLSNNSMESKHLPDTIKKENEENKDSSKPFSPKENNIHVKDNSAKEVLSNVDNAIEKKDVKEPKICINKEDNGDMLQSSANLETEDIVKNIDSKSSENVTEDEAQIENYNTQLEKKQMIGEEVHDQEEQNISEDIERAEQSNLNVCPNVQSKIQKKDEDDTSAAVIEISKMGNSEIETTEKDLSKTHALVELQSQRSKDSTLDSDNVSNKSQEQKDRTEYKEENNRSETSTSLESKVLITDSYSSSTDETVTDKEAPMSSTDTTYKDSEDNSIGEMNINENLLDTFAGQDRNEKITKGRDNISEEIKPSRKHDETITESSINQEVKSHCNDFIQTEKQHVFVEKPNTVNNTGTDLSKPNNETILINDYADNTVTENYIVKNEVLNKQNEHSESCVKEIVEHSLEDRKGNIINSIINIDSDGLLDHQIKTYINNFIQNENRHVFIDKTTDDNLNLVKANDTAPLAKEQIKNVSEVKLSEEVINSNKAPDLIHENTDGDVSEELKEEHKLDSSILAAQPKQENIDKEYINGVLQKENVHIIKQESGVINKNLAETERNFDGDLSLAKTDETELLKDLSVLTSGEEDAINSNKAQNLSNEIRTDGEVSEREIKSEHKLNTSSLVTQPTENNIDKRYINDFLQKEKENVHIIKQEGDMINKNFVETLESDFIKSDNDSDSHKHVHKLLKLDTLDKKPENENSIKSKSETTANRFEGSTKQSKPIKEDRKMRRIKSVDVIRDESKHKTQIKSRIPTADYRSRVKRDDNGTHSMRLKRSTSNSDNDRAPVQDGSPRVAEKNNSSMNKDETKLLSNELLQATVIKSKNHDQEGSTTKQTKESHSSSDISNDSNIKITGKVKEDNINVPNQTEAETVAKEDISVKEIIAAIRIQALWKGFKVRKVKAKISKQPAIDDAAIIPDDIIHTRNKHIAPDIDEKSVVENESKQQNEDFDKQNEYNPEKAAVIIQKNWRGFKVRNGKDLKSTGATENVETAKYKAEKEPQPPLKLEDDFIKAATLIQKIWRGFQVRKLLKINSMAKSAEMINIEDMKSRKKKEAINQDKVKSSQEVVDQKQLTTENEFVEAAIFIQKIWRGFKVRKVFKDTSKQPPESNKKNDSMMVPVNAKHEEIIKKQMTTENMANQKLRKSEPSLNSEEEFFKAATLIQKIWRGFRARNSLKLERQKTNKDEPVGVNVREVTTDNQNTTLLEENLQSKTQREDTFVKAATTIQKIWRGFKVRKLLKSNSKQEIQGKRLVGSETLINEGCYKSDAIEGEIINNDITTTQKLIEPKLSLKSDEEFIKAAILIQTIWRGFKVRNLLKKNVKSKNAEDIVREGSEKLSSKEGTTQHAESILSQIRQVNQSKTEDDFVRAAILIQKIWRGFKVRKINSYLKCKTDNKGLIDLPMPIKEPDLKCIKEGTINDTSMKNQKPAELKSSLTSGEEFTKAAILIQKIWRGFKVRNQLKRKSKPLNDLEHANNNEKVTTVILTKQDINEDEFVKAAVLIQKVWRGFKVRNISNKKFNSENESKQEKAVDVKNKAAMEDVMAKQIIRDTAQNPSQMRLQNEDELSKNKNKQSISSDKLGITHTESDDKLVKAATIIQKVWRGFKVRKVRQRRELFGQPIENKKPEIEAVKEIDPKSKKSALKIQSLWRGYQVRKNINVIKNKLEETMTSNDADKGRELTDGDILNAATKIQAGVRGYLQRKKYKNNVNKLNCISEEDYAEKRKLKSGDTTVGKGQEDNFNTNENKLSEEEVLKALEDLNKLEVPIDIPVLHETDKPTFYRSNTVQEPQIERKHNAELFKSNTIDRTKEIKDTSTSFSSNIDNNNNADKFKEISPLETKVKDTVNTIMNVAEENPSTLMNDESNVIGDIMKSNIENIADKLLDVNDCQQLSDDPTKNTLQQTFNDNDIKEDPVVQNKLSLSQTSDLNDKGSDIKSETENNSIKISTHGEHLNEDVYSKPINDDTGSPIRTLTIGNNSIKHINSLESETTGNVSTGRDAITNQNMPYNLEGNYNCHKDTLEHNTKAEFPIVEKEIGDAALHDENNHITGERNVYERPLSMYSNDSVVTVIYKDIPDKYDENGIEGSETNSDEADKTIQTDIKSNKALSEHETLIGDLQNKLLDQISGRNGSHEETVDKFDIEQLRKELEEAGLIHNTDDNNHIRHENSRELLDEHDQLLDYLEGFELSSSKHEMENSSLKDLPQNLPSRELSDIKEEDIDSKIPLDIRSRQINSAVPSKNISETVQDKVEQSVLPSGIITHKDALEGELNIEKIKSTLKECEDIAREINMEFQVMNHEPAVKSAHIDSLPKKITESSQSEQLFCGTNEKQSGNEVVSNDVELIAPVDSQIRSALSVTLHGDQNKCGEDSSNQNDPDKSIFLNGLLHTGEMHDSVLVPFPKESDSKPEDLPEDINVEKLPKDVTEVENSKLLHTGELHDTVVIPFPLRAQDNLETEKQTQYKDVTLTTIEPISLSTSNPNIETEKIDNINRLSPKGLLHTGEFHDTLVTPLPLHGRQSSKENYDKSVKSLETNLVQATQNIHIPESSSKQDSNQPTKLLHTGELHDPVVLPFPKKTTEETTEDTKDGNADTTESRNSPRQVDSECQTSGDPDIAVQLEVPDYCKRDCESTISDNSQDHSLAEPPAM